MKLASGVLMAVLALTGLQGSWARAFAGDSDLRNYLIQDASQTSAQFVQAIARAQDPTQKPDLSNQFGLVSGLRNLQTLATLVQKSLANPHTKKSALRNAVAQLRNPLNNFSAQLEASPVEVRSAIGPYLFTAGTWLSPIETSFEDLQDPSQQTVSQEAPSLRRSLQGAYDYSARNYPAQYGMVSGLHNLVILASIVESDALASDFDFVKTQQDIRSVRGTYNQFMAVLNASPWGVRQALTSSMNSADQSLTRLEESTD